MRSALREDPDIVLVGEMRDLETVESALKIAETGHLTFATLHTNSTTQTINRIIDIFPANQQSQVRTQLSLVLEGIVCQTLLPKIGGGRIVGLEIMVPDARDPEPDPRGQDPPDLLGDADRPGKDGHADDEPVPGDAVSTEARSRSRRRSSASSNKDELQDLINRGVGVVAGAGLARPGAPRPVGAAR